MGKVWRSVLLFVAFHKDRSGKPRRDPYLWRPDDGQASVTDKDADGQEAFVVVKGADASVRDVQIKARPDKIIVRRNEGLDWSGIVITDHGVSVRVGEHWIEVKHDGSVKRETGGEVTFLEATGEIFRLREFEEIIVSADGETISRRRPQGVAAITRRGVMTNEAPDEFP